MENRYKAIVSNKWIFKEIELPPDGERLTVGTGVNSDVRLGRENFFEAFELVFQREGAEWGLYCSDNCYLTTGSAQKLLTKRLTHGDELYLRYQESEGDALRIVFMIDFEFEKYNYDRRIDLSGASRILIGGTEDCHVFLSSRYIGRDAVALTRTQNGYVVSENNTRYGVYVNGGRRRGEILLGDRDFFSFGEFSFYLKENSLYTAERPQLRVSGLPVRDVSESKSCHVYPHFNRSTRMKTVFPKEGIPVLDPPPEPSKPSGNIVLQLLPAIVMLGVTVLFRMVLSTSGGAYIWISLISMTLGICTSVASIVSERQKYRKEVRERETAYEGYINKKRELIQESRGQEKALLDGTYYSVQDEIHMVEDFTSQLFNRSREDEDYLEVRLGTGRRKALRQIEYKRQEKFEGTDRLAAIPAQMCDEYAYIGDVPVTVDLKNANAVGFVGCRRHLGGMLKNLTVDLATRQYYGDMRMFFVFGEECCRDFQWLRFLPHIWNDALNMRNFVCDTDSKNILFEYLYKELTRRSGAGKERFTDLVVFVYSDLGLKRHPISRFLESAAGLQVHFLFFEENADLLPDCCDSVVTLSDERNGVLAAAEDAAAENRFVYEAVDTSAAERTVLKLAPVYCDEVSLEGSLTKNITLFELLNILNVDDIDLEKNWREAQVYKSLAAPLGVKAKNQIVSLDLNEKHHGPHGLVAGTTGSGKSEILQSYILSMAVRFHPYEVGFVIIDFKGGGMVNQFAGLPHLAGAITDIDGREIDRSLLSIKAELNKRKALFAEYGVNHVDSYIRLYKNGEAKTPLPHLILIVDEFAELKMEQPEFMKELISAARIGRSLGIHLILATQKPSGVVDAQIWSNSKFRLCLKVQNKEDSNEVLKTPVAAEIKEPGRAYLQVGNNEIFELFQSAYSGGPASVEDGASARSFTINKLDLSGRRTSIYTREAKRQAQEKDTQLDAIVKHIAAYCDRAGIRKMPGICLPPLGELYAIEEAEQTGAGTGGIVIPIGIFDDPESQRQDQVNLNVSETNTFILGSSQFGKTCMLQTMIRGLAENYLPEEVNIYILDFASLALKVFDGLKHVGGVVIPGEDEKLKLFFKIMGREVKTRKEKFSQMGITSYQSYREAGYRDLPQIVLLLDNMTAFRELCGDYDEALLNLCREGTAVGMSVNVTAQQMSGIGYKYLAAFGNKYGLTCNDKSEYASLFDRCRMEPKNVPGRGLTVIDKELYEFQTFLGFQGEKEIQRVEAIRGFIERRNAQCGALYARRIPEVPGILTQEYLERTFGKAAGGGYYLGIDYDTVEPVMLSGFRDGYLAISGREKSGRSNYIRYLFGIMQRDIFSMPVEAYIIDDYDQKLGGLKDYGFVEKYTTDATEFEMILDEIQSQCEDRADQCREEGNACLENMPLLAVVVNNAAVYDAGKITKDACAQWKELVKSHKSRKLLFILAGIENAAVGFGGSEILKFIKESKNILFFDDLAKIKITDVPAAQQRQFKKQVEPGDAFYITGAGIAKLRTPLWEEQ